MSDWAKDPVVVELRELISSADRVILETVNQRLELVSRLRDYKQERGYPFVDKAREDALIDELTRVNPGPLSTEGLRELYLGLLEIMKREAASQNVKPL
jgi:chorismate mutase